MGDSDAADLMGIGRQCAVPNCLQADFLPFTCGACGKVYCLEHRMCPCHTANQPTVVKCPVCSLAIVVQPGEDPNAVFDRHELLECDPSNHARVHNKPRCAVTGCRQRLGPSTTYQCRDCGVEVCLRHRFQPDHMCPGKPHQHVQQRSGWLSAGQWVAVVAVAAVLSAVVVVPGVRRRAAARRRAAEKP